MYLLSYKLRIYIHSLTSPTCSEYDLVRPSCVVEPLKIPVHIITAVKLAVLTCTYHII